MRNSEKQNIYFIFNKFYVICANQFELIEFYQTYLLFWSLIEAEVNEDLLFSCLVFSIKVLQV